MSDMTDLEITRLCAEAMEAPPTLPGSSDIWAVSIAYRPEGKSTKCWVRSTYDPLHDDAQAMALVKKFDMRIAEHSYDHWRAAIPNQQIGLDYTSHEQDLNRAICECVARMQKARG